MAILSVDDLTRLREFIHDSYGLYDYERCNGRYIIQDYELETTCRGTTCNNVIHIMIQWVGSGASSSYPLVVTI
jgi:hypothetical protein